MLKKCSFLLMAALLLIGGLIGCSQEQPSGGENAPGVEQPGVSIDPPQSEDPMETETESVPTTGLEGDSPEADPAATGTEGEAETDGSTSTDTPDTSEGNESEGESTTETQQQ